MKRPDDAGWIDDVLAHAREAISLLGEETVENLESNRLAARPHAPPQLAELLMEP